MVAGYRQDRHIVMRVRFVELRVVITVRTGELHDVTDMVAEPWNGVRAGEAFDHVLGDVALEFGILHATRIGYDVQHQLAVTINHRGRLW